MAELILSDGTRSYDFLAEPTPAIYVQQDGLVLPVVSREDTFAEGSDSEGRTRVRSRALNSEAGSFAVYFKATNATDFWDAVDNLQELVESAHRNKGTLTYTPPGGVAVTFDLEAISVSELPQRGVMLRAFHGEATVTFEAKPYGRLAEVNNAAYISAAYSLGPAVLLALDADAGLTDLSGNGRNGTAVGGLTVGGYSPGPLAVGDEGATNFDGTDDRVSTTYATRQNLVTNPRGGALATTGWSTSAGVVNAGATITAVNDWRTTAFNVSTTGAAVAQGAYIPFNLTSGTSVQARIRLKRTAGTGTIYARVVRNSSPWTTHDIVAASTQTDFSELTLDFTPNFTGEWVLIVSVNEASATTFRFTECLVGPAGTYFDGAGFENPEGFYQPSVGQSGWRGTAHASISDLGSFANGVSRTWMGWAYRDASGTNDALFGGSNNGIDGIVCQLASGGNNVQFSPQQSGGATTWTGAWPGNGQWVHWAVVFNEPANLVSLYINGALVSTETQSLPFVTGSTLEVGSSAGASVFDGKMQGFAAYEQALTATQIANIFAASLGAQYLYGPIDHMLVSGVPGQVSAWGDLTLTDADSVARNHVEVGVQHDYDANNPEPLLLQAVVDLDAQGGSSNTRSGSYSSNILRAALTTSPVAVCTSGEQPHKGLWKVRARVYPSATGVRVRLAWRAGDGPFAWERWVQVPNEDDWYDLDLGTVNIPELPSGHVSEFRVEAAAASGVPTLDVDFLALIPADNYTKLRGASSADVGTGGIIAVDDFSTQTSGAVTGKTPLLAPAGNWSGAGDADDFQVDTSVQNIYREASTDSALNNGRYLRCGTGVLAATIIKADINTTLDSPFSVAVRCGLMLRYTDTSNWLMCVYTGFGTLSLIKRVAGSETVLRTASGFFAGTRTLTVGADTSGNVLVYEGPRNGTETAIALIIGDSSLATAGALATGGYGFYDATTSGTYNPRTYDNFVVSTLVTDATVVTPAMNAGHSTELTHETALTESASNTSTTPIREGKYLTLPPSTRNDTKSRVVVKARRNDSDLGLPDTGLTDDLTGTLTVTPRVHLTGN
jgi:hypothetical protein